MTGVQRFPMRVAARWRLPLLLYGVRQGNTYVELDDDRFHARFGRFGVTTPLSNIEGFDITGPYRWWRALGLRVSLGDRGVSFGTTARGGVCVRLREPVRVVFIGPHPSVTATVDDLEGLAAALRARGIEGGDRRSTT